MDSSRALMPPLTLPVWYRVMTNKNVYCIFSALMRNPLSVTNRNLSDRHRGKNTLTHKDIHVYVRIQFVVFSKPLFTCDPDALLHSREENLLTWHLLQGDRGHVYAKTWYSVTHHSAEAYPQSLSHIHWWKNITRTHFPPPDSLDSARLEPPLTVLANQRLSKAFRPNQTDRVHKHTSKKMWLLCLQVQQH